MWSGPRNISTALMRACGEPARRLGRRRAALRALPDATSRVAHPGVDEVIAHHDSDWQRVVRRPHRPDPRGPPGLLPEAHGAPPAAAPRAASGSFALTNAFLIRHPAEMLPSLAAKMGHAGAARHRPAAAGRDLSRGAAPHRRHAAGARHRGRAEGSARRARDASARGSASPSTSACCTGRPDAGRPTASGRKHWYDAVERSTGFEPYAPRPRQVGARSSSRCWPSACPTTTSSHALRLRA